MADNVAVTEGSGKSVATDDVGGQQYQRVKLTDGTADSSTHLKIVAEDAAHSTGDTGIVAMVVRNDTLAALAGTDGDYSVLQVDGNGALYVLDSNSGDILTAVQLIDNLVLTEDTAHQTGDVGVQFLAVRNDTLAALAGSDGDYAPIQVDANGAIYVLDSNSAAISTALTAIQGTTDVVGGGVEATALRVTIASDSTGVVTVDDGGASLTIDNAQLSVVGGGTEAAAMRVTIANDSTGVVTVDDGGSSLTVDNAQLSVVGGGTEAAAMRVTLANDSTGVVSVDDNGAALTVDNANIDGPGAGSAFDSLTSAVVDLAAATANQVLVSSAPSKQIWVYGLHVMADTGAGVITLQDEDDTALTGAIAVADEGGFVRNPSGNFQMPWLKLGTDKDLEADTTGTATFDGIITYSIVSV